MKDVIGPYRTGPEVRRGAGWTLHAGHDTDRGEDVWALHIEHAAQSLDDVRRRATALKDVTDALATPSALSPDRPHLISITRAAGYCPIARQAPSTPQSTVRVIESAVHAIRLLHDSGQAHGSLDGWLIDADGDGLVRLRGAAELARPGDDAAYREDVRTLARSLRAHLRDALNVDLDTALRDASRTGDSDALLQVAMPVAAGYQATAVDLAGTYSVNIDQHVTVDPTESGTVDQSPFPAVASPMVEHSDSLERDHHPERDLLASLRAAPLARPPHVPPTSRERRRTPSAPSGRHARPAPVAERRRAWWLAPIAATVLVALVTVASLGDGNDDDEASERRASTSAAATPTPTSTAASPQADIEARLHELYAARASAIAARDRQALQAVYVPGSAMLMQDESLINQLAADGSQVDGFTLELVDVQAVQTDGATAVVNATDQIPPFDIVAVDGTRTAVNGRPQAAVTITLAMTDAGWLLSAVERA